MILIDSSAWIEFLRGSGSPAHRAVEEALRGNEIASTDPVHMEILAGAKDGAHLRALRRLLGRTHLLAVKTEDWEAAAGVYRACRASGTTPRSLVDCLIAAVAIRHSVALLHADRDYAAIAANSSLAVAEIN